MKRILTLILCAVMVIPIFGTQNISAQEILFAEDYEKAVSVLKHIGIVDEFNTENGGNAYNTVSRAKFSEMVAKALKLNNTSDTVYFSDVSGLSCHLQIAFVQPYYLVTQFFHLLNTM